MDVHDPETRSYNMSRIKGKDTKPEVLVRKCLFAKGFRYRLQVKDLPGKPDIVLPKYKTAIFVNGCFWHGHKGCRYFTLPKSQHPFATARLLVWFVLTSFTENAIQSRTIRRIYY